MLKLSLCQTFLLITMVCVGMGSQFKSASPFGPRSGFYSILIPSAMIDAPYFTQNTSAGQLPISGYKFRSELTLSKLFVVGIGYNQSWTTPLNLIMSDLQVNSVEAIPNDLFYNSGPNIHTLTTPIGNMTTIIGYRRDPYVFIWSESTMITSLSPQLNNNMIVNI